MYMKDGLYLSGKGTGTGTGNIYSSQKQQNRVFNTKTIQYITSMST